MTLKDFVNFKLTHADKTAESSGYPLIMENCKVNKKMKQLQIFGNSVQDGIPTPEIPIEVQSVGGLVTDTNDANYGKYKIPIVTKGKNSLKPTSVSAEAIRADRYPRTKNNYGTTIDTTDLSDNSVTVTQISNSNYQPVSYQNGFICILTDGLTVGKKYNISFDIDIHENPLNVTFITLMPGGMASYNVAVGSQKRRTGCTYTHALSTQQYAYPFMEIRCMGMSFTASNFMITEVDFDDSYEPYVEPIKTNVFLNEPLRKIGDYEDYIDFKNKKVVRELYEYYIDGTQTVSRYDDNTMLVRTNGAKCKRIYDFGMSNRFPMQSYGQKNGVAYMTHANNNNNIIQIGNCLKIDGVTDAATLKDWFITHHTTWTQALTTPTEEPIECELPKLKAKTSIIEVDTTVLPSNIQGKYIKK